MGGLKGKIKFYLVLAAFSLGGFFFLLLLVTGGGSGTAAAPPVATEEKSEEYGIICSQMGVPWQIVILTDAIYAQQEGKGGIEDLNPFDTALEFLIMEERREDWVKTGTETHTDSDGDTYTEDIYEWVHASTAMIKGKEEILDYIHRPNTRGMTANILRTTAENIAAGKSNSTTKYIRPVH